jgi:hypothetical protein
LNAAIRALDKQERDTRNMLDGESPTGSTSLSDAWVSRIADELGLLELAKAPMPKSSA